MMFPFMNLLEPKYDISRRVSHIHCFHLVFFLADVCIYLTYCYFFLLSLLKVVSVNILLI